MAEKKVILNVEKWILEIKFSKPMVEELIKCDIEYLQETDKAVKVLFTSEEIEKEVWLPKKTKKGEDIVTFKN